MGEAATGRFHGNLPPTLTLPRQGEGIYWYFCNYLFCQKRIISGGLRSGTESSSVPSSFHEDVT